MCSNFRKLQGQWPARLRHRLSVPIRRGLLTEENELLRFGRLGFLGRLGGFCGTGFLCAFRSCVGIRNDAESESGDEQQSEQTAHKISISRIMPSLCAGYIFIVENFDAQAENCVLPAITA